MWLRYFPINKLLRCEANRVMEVSLIIHQSFPILELNPFRTVLVFSALTHNFTLIRRDDDLSQIVWELETQKMCSASRNV